MSNVETDYFKVKMQENRDQWSSIGVTNTTISLPNEYIPYMRAFGTVMCAKKLMAAIDSRADDEAFLAGFANRQPRVPFKTEDVLHLEEDSYGVKGKLIAFLRDRHEEKQAYQRALDNGDALAMFYHMASEYALCYLARGLWQMLQVVQSGDQYVDIREVLK